MDYDSTFNTRRETCILLIVELCGWQPCGGDAGVVYLCNSIDSGLVRVRQSLNGLHFLQECDSWPQQPASRPIDIFVVLGRKKKNVCGYNVAWNETIF